MNVGFPYRTRKGKLTIAFADEVNFDPATATVTAVLHGWPGRREHQPKWALIFGNDPGAPPHAERLTLATIVEPGDTIHMSMTLTMPWDRPER